MQLKSKRKDIVNVEEPALCIQRKKAGRGYVYFDANNKKITSKKILNRLKKIIIPPMWDNVMICNIENGHLQATGRDAKGRKQYIYHSEWERLKQEEKFNRMAEFGNKLPILRKRCQKDLKQKNWSKTKILALMVKILDESGIRIGNRQYARENSTYGLSTLRKKHLKLNGKELEFRYRGKSHQQRF